MMPSWEPALSTRDRLVQAGMRLFADRGFKATTVGAIEAAVGLQPRRGALYKHFASKRALLDVGVDQHLEAIGTAAAQLRDLEIGSIAAGDAEQVRAFLVVLGRWFLDQLDAQRDLTRVLEHDGQHLAAVAEVVHDEIIDVGYGAAAALLRSVDPDIDADALAVVLVGALAAARRTEWTFGATPLGVDDDRLLDAWAATCLSVRDAMRRRDP